MNKTAEISVTLSFGFGHFERASLKVAEPYVRAYAPIDRLTGRSAYDPLLRMATGGKDPDTMCVITRQRESLAKEIAEHLTRIIMTQMERRDTINGDKIERSQFQHQDVEVGLF